MKVMMIFFGIAVMLSGFILGHASRMRVEKKEVVLDHLRQDTVRVNEKIEACKGLPHESPRDLIREYTGFINDIHAMGRAEGMMCGVIVPGVIQGDVAHSAGISSWDGVRQLNVQVVCPLGRGKGLLSLLDVFTDIERNGSVVIRGMHQDKDVLRAEFLIVGR